MAAPLILPVKDDLVMVRYSRTLTLYLPQRLLRRLVDAALADSDSQQVPVPVPVYFYYEAKKGDGIHWTVFGPFKVAVTVEVSGVYAAAPGEGAVFADVPMVQAVVTGHGDAGELCRLAGGRRASVKIVEVLSAPRVMEYVAVNGRMYRAVWLRGAAAARVLSGYRVGGVPQAVLVNPPAGAEPGDIVEACWVAMKAGRGDFHDSGTSHQLNIYVHGDAR